QVLLDGQREVGTTLDGRVVRHDHALAALDDAYTGDDPGPRGLTLVQVPRGQGVQLEEGGAGVDEPVDPLARGQLAARPMLLKRGLAATPRHLRGPFPQLPDELLHAGPPLRVRLGLRGEDGHRREPTRPISTGRG